MVNDLDKLTRSDIKKEVVNDINNKNIKSYEYSTFVNEKIFRKSWYEKGCKKFGNIFSISLTKREKEVLEKQIIDADLNVRPKEVNGFALFSLLASFVLILIFVVFVLIFSSDSFLYSLFLLPVSFIIYLFIRSYPKSIAEKRILETSSEMVLGVLYIVIYMKHNPNLELAIKFASKNLHGYLSLDFKKLLWDIQTKKYNSMQDALNNFLLKWKENNKPFVNSMNLIVSSLHQIDENKREKTLDRAIASILDGTYEVMVNYVNSLKTPVQAVSLIGITLPILTLVMLPMVSAFLSDIISPTMIFMAYDVFLPIIVFFFIKKVMGKRPIGFNIPDISKHPDVPPKGKFFLNNNGKRLTVPIFIIPLIVLVFGVVSFLLYINYAKYEPMSSNDVFGSLTIILGISISIASYFYLSSFQKIKIRKQIDSVESEFTNVAFILSNFLSEGKPLELSIIKTAEQMKSSSIYNFFEKIKNNINKLGFDVEKAIFDKKYGAIKLYPSLLVNSIMRILVSTSKESTEACAMSMENIGKYTKSLHSIDSKIKDVLSETISSVSFQAKFIAPLIMGVVVGLSTMIFLILNNLGEQMSNIATNSADIGGMGGGMNLDVILNFLNIKNAVQIYEFQPIVGLYLIIVTLLMVYLLNQIRYSGDDIYFKYTAGKTLITSIILYCVITGITTLLFGGLAGLAFVVNG